MMYQIFDAVRFDKSSYEYSTFKTPSCSLRKHIAPLKPSNNFAFCQDGLMQKHSTTTGHVGQRHCPPCGGEVWSIVHNPPYPHYKHLPKHYLELRMQRHKASMVIPQNSQAFCHVPLVKVSCKNTFMTKKIFMRTMELDSFWHQYAPERLGLAIGILKM